MSAQTGTLWWLPRILECQQLDPAETLIMVALAQHVDADDACFLGIEKMAAAARVSYATVRRRLVSLEERGFLARSRRRRGDGNLSVYDFALLRDQFEADSPALNLSGDQRSPGRAMTTAHQGERAELPRSELPRVEHSSSSSSTETGQTATAEDELLAIAEHRALIAYRAQTHTIINPQAWIAKAIDNELDRLRLEPPALRLCGECDNGWLLADNGDAVRCECRRSA